MVQKKSPHVTQIIRDFLEKVSNYTIKSLPDDTFWSQADILHFAIKQALNVQKIILIWKNIPIKFLPYAEFCRDKIIYSCINQSVSNALLASAGDKNMTKSKKDMKKYNNTPNLES